MANHTTDAQASGPPKRTLLFGIAATVLLFDIITKVAAVAFIDPQRPISIIGDVVTLRLIRNPGAAFSMATGMTWLLTILAVVVTVVVVRIGGRLRSAWWVLGLGLVLGGAVGNLIDRIFRSPGPMRGHVVDFVSVGWFPIFNVADSAVVCGAILIVALNIFNVDPGGPAELLTGKPAPAPTADPPVPADADVQPERSAAGDGSPTVDPPGDTPGATPSRTTPPEVTPPGDGSPAAPDGRTTGPRS